MQTLQNSVSEVIEHRSGAEIGRYSRMADNFPRLWSNVEQVYQILRIDTDDSLGTEAYRFQHIKSRTGSRVYTGGDRCDAIFIVYAGFLKTSWIDKYGNEKILDFPMKGDLIGFDGIESKAFKNTLVALSDIELIVVPLDFFSGNGSKAHGFRRRLMELMSNALV
ncbi:MAG: Crp/Fnr family transcriptional regulator, partial [Burkholderiaceae bacterium]